MSKTQLLHLPNYLFWKIVLSPSHIMIDTEVCRVSAAFQHLTRKHFLGCHGWIPVDTRLILLY
jgi:hypothetical protein